MIFDMTKRAGGGGGGNANVSQDENGYIVIDNAAPSGNYFWVEKTAATTVNRANNVLPQLFPTIQTGKKYFAYVKDKETANYVNGQMLCISVTGDNKGGGVRWRDGATQAFNGVDSSILLSVEAGDKYMVCEVTA